jgi:hypothetical protein
MELEQDEIDEEPELQAQPADIEGPSATVLKKCVKMAELVAKHEQQQPLRRTPQEWREVSDRALTGALVALGQLCEPLPPKCTNNGGEVLGPSQVTECPIDLLANNNAEWNAEVQPIFEAVSALLAMCLDDPGPSEEVASSRLQSACRLLRRPQFGLLVTRPNHKPLPFSWRQMAKLKSLADACAGLLPSTMDLLFVPAAAEGGSAIEGAERQRAVATLLTAGRVHSAIPLRICFGRASSSITYAIVEALDDMCEIKFRSLVASPERVALIEQVVKPSSWRI